MRYPVDMAAGGQHQVYITAHFGLTGAWAGEFAQCGWRMGYVPAGAVPAPGATFTPQVANITDGTMTLGSDATWTWANAWTAEYGADIFDQPKALAVANAIKTYWDAVKGEAPSLVRLESVKIALIKPDGSYAYPSSVYQLLTPLPGTSSSAVVQPPEVAVCTTLRAPVLGRRGRGRWYLPAPTNRSSTTTDGKVAAAWRTTLANAGKALVNALDAVGAPGTDFTPIVAVASATSTTMVRPAEVRVGDHYDVQRRRQHQVDEVYTSVAL
jgi:hypothetical protein